MKTIKLLILLSFLSGNLFSQSTKEVILFDKLINQFLNVRDFTISEEGNEAFFTVQSPNQEISQIVSIRKNETGIWSEPVILSFCDSFMYLEPFLSPDGIKLFFASDRPLSNKSQKRKDFDIWYVERKSKNAEWSTPINIEKPVNSEYNEFYPSVSANNNLYFTMESPEGMGKDDIYFSSWKNGKYTKPVLLSGNINSTGYEFNAFISQKEDFMLFTKYNAKGGLGSGDLYISKKDSTGQWMKAVNLNAPINTMQMEYCPYYDERTKTLYFTSKRGQLTSKSFENISDFNQYVSGSNNGLSKIYKTTLIIEP